MLVGVVIVAPLWMDDNPIPDHLRRGYIAPRANEGARYGADHLYTRRRVKHRARKGTVDHVGINSEE